MEKIFVGRQPILNRNEIIFGFELLFRRGHTSQAGITNGSTATASVIVHSLNDLGLENIIGKKKGFINVNAEILFSDFIELLPPNNIILEILEGIEIDHKIIEACKSLKAKGFCLAIDDFVSYESVEPLIPIADFIKVDLIASDKNNLPELLKILKRYPVRLLAEKVETKEDFEFCMKHGFELFQGYFFQKPVVIEGATASPSQLLLLELFNEVSRERDIEIIEGLFKKSPELDIKLLNFLNSASFYLRHRISSIRHAIISLGYRNLQKWIALLLFAKQGVDIKSNPLMERAAIKGMFMENMTKRITKSKSDADSAFITGILSISDVLLNMPMDKVVGKLNLSEDIQRALLKREGLLGDVLSLAEMLEKEDITGMMPILGRYNVTLEEVFQMELDSIIGFEQMETPQ
ncbi:MAG TPA: EAL domain-containing protein [Syntrophorhabdaceae bacterium]|nr:EAL domain-containing protein [Syntrophorhabdaceae bacterium]HOT41053.1 EAL domain-containing protein [Syntrophorhabdaceae bacterium]HPC66244.1 EAL domain-containing protein [Syntrophorhabdaceae bacterium]HQE79079.1 EAL domain-containing protein [Syntrophorhabdaceae bacterium]HQH42672.1 EAL domain-containing protein [Syntrophorhabdaceae bacterium]